MATAIPRIDKMVTVRKAKEFIVFILILKILLAMGTSSPAIFATNHKLLATTSILSTLLRENIFMKFTIVRAIIVQTLPIDGLTLVALKVQEFLAWIVQGELDQIV